MEGFLTFILFAIIGFWLLGKIGRWFLRFWIAKKQKEFASQFGDQFGGGGGGSRTSQARQEETGRVKVSVDESAHKTEVNKNVGDYVDFEEVK